MPNFLTDKKEGFCAQGFFFVPPDTYVFILYFFLLCFLIPVGFCLLGTFLIEFWRPTCLKSSSESYNAKNHTYRILTLSQRMRLWVDSCRGILKKTDEHRKGRTKKCFLYNKILPSTRKLTGEKKTQTNQQCWRKRKGWDEKRTSSQRKLFVLLDLEKKNLLTSKL